MEVLQCDGCDFRAESYDDLKSHIQEVHTAFLQPAEVGEDGSTAEKKEEEELEEGEEEEEEGEEDVEEDDNNDKDYKPPKSEKVPHSAESDLQQAPRSNETPVKPTAESLLPFFQCKFCVRYFRSKGFLRNHNRKVHNIIDDDDDDSRKVPGSPTSENQHYRVTEHDDEGSKVFSCRYCTYKSQRHSRISKHYLSCHSKAPSKSTEGLAELAETEGADPQAKALSDFPAIKCKGTFTCEWCAFQTNQKASWTDHMLQKHSDQVKGVASVPPLEEERSAGSSESPSSQNSPASSIIAPNDMCDNDVSPSTSPLPRETPEETRPTMEFSSFQYSQLHSVMPNSTGTSILSQRFASSNVSDSIEMLNEDDSLSCSDEDEDEDDVDETDPLFTGDSVKQLLSEEDSKMLETKGIPFRRYLNRFQCPFCSFLTMHRRSISRHIENIHLSGKTTVYKCDECPFICTSPLKLGTHKQSHSSSDVETMDLTNESPDLQNDDSSSAEPVNGGSSVGSKVNGKKIGAALNELNQQNHPHRCTLCSFSTTTLKGLRVHQQHKHSYCDDLYNATSQSPVTEQQMDSGDSSAVFVQKTQTSILGLASKKPTAGKTARKSINDLPLDLSPVKKRTRIDEIANNLQSKISQQQEDMVINLEDMEDEGESGENYLEGKDNYNAEAKNPIYTNTAHTLYGRNSTSSRDGGRVGKRKSNPRSKPRNVALTVFDDEENNHAELKDIQDQAHTDTRDTFQENLEYTEDAGVARFYCKHCDYHNKSARSVSTHYQRMHPYIKFSFRYILDPEDQSAVFRCLECFIEYTNYNDLHQHYMDHHPEASNVLNFNQPDLVYMCRFCSYTSPNVRSLMPHYQRMHPTVKINNAMIFSSYVVEQPQKTAESQTLREILNSGPKSFSSATSTPRSSSSPALKTISKTPEPSVETDALKETMGGNVVVYDCDVCSFASPNMHSVLVHYQKKHPEQKASYFRIQKTMRVISVDRTQSATPNSSFNTSMATPKSASTFGSDEEIYYCKHCVYSNRSVVGVLVHYQKRHPEIKVTAKYIKHGAPTPGLMKLMDELQIATPKQFMKQFNSSNNGCDGASNSSPKVGGADKSEAEMLFFCQQCDYGNRTVKGVLIHYQKKHRETKANADLVRRHTAVVRSQRERAQMVQSGNASSSVAAATPTADLGENSTNLRSLQCKHCSYTSPYVYALKKHLKKDHPTVKATAMTILHWAFQDGILEAGYHCEWCIYSHAEPQGLLLHYQRRHPEHNVDYTYMASKLWAGPDTTQQGGNLETKHYRCRDCAFEACSIWDITNHYQAVHPWAVKGDESVLLDIIKGQRSPTQQVAKGPTPFKFQIDGVLDISTSPHVSPPPQPHPRLSLATSSISNNPYQCTVCLSEYNSLHGLLTHYGKKHPGMKVKAADFAQEADINPSSVYKCRHCPYVNSRIHGVLTHYQKRHPLVKVTAEDFADDIEQLNDPADGDDKCKTQRQGYGAYRCKMCPYTHGTLEKLKVHYEKYHNQPASDMFSPTFTQFSASKHTEQVGECSVTTVLPSAPADAQQVSDFDLALSQFPVNKTEKHAIFKCQLCKYFCSTRKGIARHYRIKHNNVRAQPEGKNNVFKCALCAYTNPIRKGLAAHYQKRHDIDAYYTHCLAASKTLTEKPPKVVVPLPSDGGGGAELSEDLRLAVERKKCSLCAFQAFSRKSIVSHYIKRHPGVFPKKQHSSKLGRYFTVIYAKESEKIGVETTAAEHEDNKEVLEVQLKPEEQGAEEWLPFKCMKCFRLSFSTTELLSIHYNDHHSKDLKRDFVLQPSPSEDNLELYQCSHCELRFLALTDLAKHLTNHSEDFQKRFMRQERRRQLLSKQKALEPPETKAEKESLVNKAPIGFRCNFCVEMHPTLRAICNHLRKHVQYGEVKEGHVKQEVSEVPLGFPAESLTNGDVDEYNSPATGDLETVTQRATIGHSSVAMEARTDFGGSGGRGAALIAAARAVVSATAAASAGGAQEKERLAAGGHPCGQCDRVFMSMQGLRSHERSHSAMALFSREDKYSCQYCQFVSPFRHNLDRHVQSHHGHHKPFRCKLCPFKSAYLSRLKSHLHKAHAGEHTYKCLSCPFSSMTISQLKEHSLRDHGEALTLPKIRAATQAALRPSRLGSDAEPSLMGLHPDDPAYHEPADVRQQLSHFQLASRGQAASRGPVAAAVDGRPDGILTCEFCEFSSGYMQSLRRHYRDRHGGKKLFKCKDCSFFTCYKSSFTMHVEAGHSSPPEEGPKDLRCPFCLYHTRHKSNMIDHIVLHRDDRVAPLEVSRSKLSRHLQGLVFRCHKCTFTCSSDLALQQHLRKHAELKPYQCQLCYYDSSQRHQLEEHLRLEHKVLRNFELMGRVNLDQLEMMKERGNSTDEEEKEMVALEEEHEGVVPLRDEVMEENDFGQGVDLKDEEMEEEIKAEEDENEEEKEAKIAQDLAAPICNNSNVSGGVPDKRLPCEFCGRCFTNGTEWERHVLRHGMTVNNNRSDSSNAPAIEASAPPSIGSAGIAHKDMDLSSNSVDVEEDYPNNLSERRHDESEDDKGLLETKNDQ